ncbi:N(2)-acetyl-L-2,4-diaminobutanoate deacetylase DoeB [Chelativorans sp.]|uniref:N(2)-acetyl-L-2,4-diaminobutanoate deacetylase DoeB n=1 Tax=Chelativorans sp. TaxID=2203393 RepID=UPI0028110574|nr:N(2)-acetyl-L-2,4-diaminobutanoate deacetylase DoeB [Chelativorans sp.]
MATNSLPPSPIAPTVDFSAEGVQHGFLRLPYSRDESAWGSVMIPICVIRNGRGPTALLTGGNHGDEYEGPVALYDLARTLQPDQVSGTVIIVPAMNYPAFVAGTRTSPIDKGNLNRSFPGRPDGTVTQKIADYFQRELLPRADLVLDFHSGGKTLDFLPFAAAHILADKALERKAFAAVEAFSAPWSVKMLEIDAVGMYDTAAEEMGKIFVTTELGGGGTARAETVRIAKRGVLNVLRHASIVKGPVDRQVTRWLDMPSDDCFSFAEVDGLLEPMIDLGGEIAKGATIARVHPVGRTGQAPHEIKSKMAGLLAARHFPGLVQAGDCVSVVAAVVSGAQKGG